MDILFWTALMASGTVGLVVGSIFGIVIARRQLIQLNRSSSIEGILMLFKIFDDEKHRENRNIIWDKKIKLKKFDSISEDVGKIVQITATQMDVVGSMIKHKRVEKELIFERYAEVICPLWEEIEEYIKIIRTKKGGFGWDNFEFMYKQAKEWSAKVRKVTSYRRF